MARDALAAQLGGNDAAECRAEAWRHAVAANAGWVASPRGEPYDINAGDAVFRRLKKGFPDAKAVAALATPGDDPGGHQTLRGASFCVPSTFEFGPTEGIPFGEALVGTRLHGISSSRPRWRRRGSIPHGLSTAASPNSVHVAAASPNIPSTCWRGL